MSGMISRWAALISTSMARQAAAYFTEAEVTAPLAAAAVKMAGMAALE